MSHPPLHGIVFDLDGTLIDSRLDFDRMRREMQLPPGAPILETLETLPPERRALCLEILQRHEEAGALRAALMPGVASFLAAARRQRLHMALVTRNTRKLVLAIVQRLALQFDPIVAREDGPIKPDPAAIRHACRLWNVTPAEVLVIGDFRFDVEAGRQAGARTALVLHGRDRAALPWAGEADYVIEDFTQAGFLLGESP